MSHFDSILSDKVACFYIKSPGFSGIAEPSLLIFSQLKVSVETIFMFLNWAKAAPWTPWENVFTDPKSCMEVN